MLIYFSHCPENFTCLEDIGENPPNTKIPYISFDNFLWSLLTSLQLVTLDSWEIVYNSVCLKAQSLKRIKQLPFKCINTDLNKCFCDQILLHQRVFSCLFYHINRLDSDPTNISLLW